MRRESLILYVRGGGDGQAFEALLADFGMTGEMFDGDIDDAVIAAEQWRIIPSFLVLDVSGATDVEGALDRLAASAPDGDTSVILVGDENDVSFYRRLRALGVADYLTKPLNLSELGDIVAEILRDRRSKGNDIDPTKTIAFIGARGGVGTSLMASTAASLLSERFRQKTLLIDGDLSYGAQHVYSDEDPSPGLVEMLDSPLRIDALFLDRAIIPVSKNMSLLSANAAHDLPAITVDAVRTLIQQAQQGMDWVLLDLPCRGPIPLDILFSVGHVFIVTTPNLLGLRDGLHLAALMDGKGYNGSVSFILNKVGESRVGAVPAAEFSRRSNRPVVELPFDPRSASLVLMESKALTAQRGPLPNALSRLVDALPVEKEQPSKGGLLGGIFGR
jgi:pilus assembly protein CpaE